MPPANPKEQLLRAAIQRVLDVVSATPGLDHCDMTEICLRGVVGVALDLNDGNNAKAAKYITTVAMPALEDFAKQLLGRGGDTDPESTDERRFH